MIPFLSGLIATVMAVTSTLENIPLRTWIDNHTAPRVAILCLHGFGLYSGSFDALGRRLAPLGYAVYAIDERGFGAWMDDGPQKDRLDFNGTISDIGKVIRSIQRTYPNLPVFIMGESMGGAIAIHAAATYQKEITGLIASAPAAQRYEAKRTDLSIALHFFRGPRRDFDIGSKVIDQATADPALRHKWGGNAMDRLDLSPDDLIRFQHFMDENNKYAKQITSLPVLMIQGSDDHLVRPKGTLEIYYNLTSPNKDLWLLGSGGHLIWEYDQFTDDQLHILNRWITDHL